VLGEVSLLNFAVAIGWCCRFARWILLTHRPILAI
jgi:hypothetical protein